MVSHKFKIFEHFGTNRALILYESKTSRYVMRKDLKITFLALSILLTGACQNGFLTSDGEDEIEEAQRLKKPVKVLGEKADEGCVPVDRFFLKEVYAPALQSACESCHGPSGEGALKSDFVLYNRGRADYLQVNLKNIREAASIEQNGESILLLKPLGRIAHGGGVVIEEGDDVYNRLKAFVEVVKADKGACKVADDSSFFKDIQYLDADQTLRKAALNLAGRLPTAAEQSGSFDEVLDAMLNEEAFYSRLTEHWNDLLLTDQYLSGEDAINLLADDTYPNRKYYDMIADGNAKAMERNAANDAIAREPIALINYIVRNDLPFTEILTADYTVVNPYSAKVYGIEGLTFTDATDGNEWKKADAAIPHSGLLSTPAYLNRYPTTDTNRNRSRSFFFLKYFMATDILKIADRPIDAAAEDLGVNPTLQADVCTSCHATLEPIAGAFQNWDSKGHYAPRERGWFPDMFPAGLNGKRLPDADVTTALSWLAQESVKDERFAYSAIEHAFRLVTAGEPLTLPKDATRGDYESSFRAYEVQIEFFKQLVAKFVASNYNFKTLIKEIVKSEYFRAVNVTSDDPQRQLELSQIGTAQLLGPERLHRKIVATTGIAWKSGDRNVLLDSREFLFLYGGIDSRSITTRMTQLNSVAASIARRMSNEVSCLSTATDFTKPQAERLLFPNVELTDMPGDEQKIRENIKHLYWQLLGERVETNDSSVNIAYQLFSNAHTDYSAEGGNGIPGRCRAGDINDDPNFTLRSWMAVVSLLLSDYNYLYE